MSEIRWWRQSSPIGEVLIAVTDRGICRVGWDDEADWDEAASKGFIAVGGHDVAHRRDEPVAALFDRYFNGDIDAFADVAVDLCMVTTDFRREVLAELHRLPVGATTTYGELAAAVGRPRGAQAVGGAVGSNPIPIVIPCHRVLAADGSLGGFSGGLPAKRWLLANERLGVPDGGWVASHRDD